MRLTDIMTVTLTGEGMKPQRFSVPRAIAKKLETIIAANLKPAKKTKSVPIEEVFPELADDRLRPATLLRGSRYKAELTQKKLAALLDIHQHHLSEMENAKRPIGKQMAKRLAHVLKCDYRRFI